ncbi:MAG: hypothetical protein ACK4UO_19010 [Pseudolabrys sp.]
MKAAALIILLGIAFGAAYAVVFSYFYPLVEKTSALSLFFGLCGLLTATAIVGLWALWNARKPAQHPTAPDHHTHKQPQRKKRR